MSTVVVEVDVELSGADTAQSSLDALQASLDALEASGGRVGDALSAAFAGIDFSGLASGIDQAGSSLDALASSADTVTSSLSTITAGDAASGLSDLGTGADAAATSLDSLGSAGDAASTGLQSLTGGDAVAGLADLATGADATTTSLASLGTAGDTASAGLTTLTGGDAAAGLSDLASGADATTASLDQLGSAGDQATAGLAQLTTGDAAAGLTDLAAGSDQATSSLDQLGAAGDQASAGLQSIASGDVAAAFGDIDTSAQQAVSSLDSLGAAGDQTVASLQPLSSGDLAAGLSDIDSGAQQSASALDMLTASGTTAGAALEQISGGDAASAFADIASSATELDTAFSTLDSSAASIAPSMDAIAGSSAAAGMADIDSSATGLVSSFGELDTSAQAVAGSMQDLTGGDAAAQLDGAAAGAAALAGAEADLGTAAQGAAGDIQQQISDLQELVASLQESNAALSEQVGSLQESKSSTEGTDETTALFTEHLTEMGVPMAVLSERFGQMSEGLSKMGESMASEGEEAASLTEGMSLLGVGLAGLVAVGVTKAVEGFTELTDMVHETADASGASADTIEGLGYAFKTIGDSADAASRPLMLLERNAGTLQTTLEAGKAPVGTFATGLEKLGLDAQAFVDMNPDERIRAIMDAFAGLGDSANKTQIAMDLFGRSGSAMIPILEMGSSAIDNGNAKIAQFGGSVANAWPEVQQWHTAQADLSTALEGFDVTLGSKVLPVMTSFLAETVAVAAGVAGLAGDIDGALSPVIGLISKLKDAWDSLPGPIKDVAEATIASMNPVFQIADQAAHGIQALAGAADSAKTPVKALSDSQQQADTTMHGYIASLSLAPPAHQAATSSLTPYVQNLLQLSPAQVAAQESGTLLATVVGAAASAYDLVKASAIQYLNTTQEMGPTQTTFTESLNGMIPGTQLLGQAFTTVATAATSMKQALADAAMASGATAAIDALRGEIDTVTQAYKDAAQAQSDLFNKATPEMASGKAQLALYNAELDNYKNILTDTNSTAAQRADAQTRINTLTATAIPQQTEYNKTVTDNVSAYRDLVTAYQAGAISQDQFNSKVNDMTVSLGKAPSFVTDLQATFKNLQTDQAAAAQGQTEIAKNLGNLAMAFDPFSVKAHEAQTTFGTAMGGILENSRTAGETVGKAMDTVPAAWGTALAPLPGVVNTAVATSTAGAADIASAGGSVAGDALDSGMVGGIQSAASTVATAAAAMVTSAVNAAKAAAGASSPSRVMQAEVGLPLAQGVGVGMDDGGPDIAKKGHSLIAQALSGMNAAASGPEALATGTSLVTQVAQGVTSGGPLMKSAVDAGIVTPFKEAVPQVDSLFSGIADADAALTAALAVQAGLQARAQEQAIAQASDAWMAAITQYGASSSQAMQASLSYSQAIASANVAAAQATEAANQKMFDAYMAGITAEDAADAARAAQAAGQKGISTQEAGLSGTGPQAAPAGAVSAQSLAGSYGAHAAALATANSELEKERPLIDAVAAATKTLNDAQLAYGQNATAENKDAVTYAQTRLTEAGTALTTQQTVAAGAVAASNSTLQVQQANQQTWNQEVATSAGLDTTAQADILSVHTSTAQQIASLEQQLSTTTDKNAAAGIQSQISGLRDKETAFDTEAAHELATAHATLTAMTNENAAATSNIATARSYEASSTDAAYIQEMETYIASQQAIIDKNDAATSHLLDNLAKVTTATNTATSATQNLASAITSTGTAQGASGVGGTPGNAPSSGDALRGAGRLINAPTGSGFGGPGSTSGGATGSTIEFSGQPYYPGLDPAGHAQGVIDAQMAAYQATTQTTVEFADALKKAASTAATTGTAGAPTTGPATTTQRVPGMHYDSLANQWVPDTPATSAPAAVAGPMSWQHQEAVYGPRGSYSLTSVLEPTTAAPATVANATVADLASAITTAIQGKTNTVIIQLDGSEIYRKSAINLYADQTLRQGALP